MKCRNRKLEASKSLFDNKLHLTDFYIHFIFHLKNLILYVHFLYHLIIFLIHFLDHIYFLLYIKYSLSIWITQLIINLCFFHY